jgi:hypothetical protein
MSHPIVTRPCPAISHRCTFVARASSVTAADRALHDHLLARHRIEYGLRRAGIIDDAGRLRMEADGTVYFPPIWHGRREWH